MSQGSIVQDGSVKRPSSPKTGGDEADVQAAPLVVDPTSLFYTQNDMGIETDADKEERLRGPTAVDAAVQSEVEPNDGTDEDDDDGPIEHFMSMVSFVFIHICASPQ